MKSLVSGAVVVGLGAAGCAGPRMVPPGDVVKDSQVLEVADRSSMTGSLVNESFKLGSFAVTDVDRDWNKKSGFSVGGYSNDTTTTGYSYKVKGSGGAWDGSCASSAKKQGVAVLGGSVDWGKTSITCECKQGGSTASLVLKSDSPDSSKGSSGELTAGGAKYKVAAVNETDKSNLGSSPAETHATGKRWGSGRRELSQTRPGPRTSTAPTEPSSPS